MTAGLPWESFFMADTVFRTFTPSETITPESIPEPVKNNVGAEENVADFEPVEGARADATVLKVLGLDDIPRNLPEDAQSNLTEFREYVTEIMKSKGISPTVGSYRRFVEETRDQMGIDRDADPDVVINRIGGILKAWKSINFISNPREKRAILMKLAKQRDSKAMDDVIYEEMNKRRVWQ